MFAHIKQNQDPNRELNGPGLVQNRSTLGFAILEKSVATRRSLRQQRFHQRKIKIMEELHGFGT
jgi:hypothetical protein